jgi:hypothetical protein
MEKPAATSSCCGTAPAKPAIAASCCGTPNSQDTSNDADGGCCHLLIRAQLTGFYGPVRLRYYSDISAF